MHVFQFLHTFLSKSLSEIHKTRLNALLQVVSSLLTQGELTLTALGRNLTGFALIKHKIKKVDRLIGNKNLWNERYSIYQAIAKKIFSSLSTAVILIDWSGCCSQEHWILQASLVGKGRSIPIYKELHPITKLANSDTEGKFLKKLKGIIPEHIKVTVVTDAGFKICFFKQVLKLNWDFVGRVRGQMGIILKNSIDWQSVKDLFPFAKKKPKCLGFAKLGKKAQLPLYLYCVTSSLQGRKAKRTKNKYFFPDKQEKYSRSHRDPWIIASSLQGGPEVTRKVMNLYSKRMQIEQNFRDDKNQRWGYGLRNSRTSQPKRLEILLLVSYIASVVLWLIGIAAEIKGLHRGFQANTEKRFRTLSLLSLARQVIQHSFEKISIKELNLSLKEIVQCQLII